MSVLEQFLLLRSSAVWLSGFVPDVCWQAAGLSLQLASWLGAQCQCSMGSHFCLLLHRKLSRNRSGHRHYVLRDQWLEAVVFLHWPMSYCVTVAFPMRTLGTPFCLPPSRVVMSPAVMLHGRVGTMKAPFWQHQRTEQRSGIKVGVTDGKHM